MIILPPIEAPTIPIAEPIDETPIAASAEINKEMPKDPSLTKLPRTDLEHSQYRPGSHLFQEPVHAKAPEINPNEFVQHDATTLFSDVNELDDPRLSRDTFGVDDDDIHVINNVQPDEQTIIRTNKDDILFIEKDGIIIEIVQDKREETIEALLDEASRNHNGSFVIYIGPKDNMLQLLNQKDIIQTEDGYLIPATPTSPSNTELQNPSLTPYVNESSPTEVLIAQLRDQLSIHTWQSILPSLQNSDKSILTLSLDMFTAEEEKKIHSIPYIGQDIGTEETFNIILTPKDRLIIVDAVRGTLLYQEFPPNTEEILDYQDIISYLKTQNLLPENNGSLSLYLGRAELITKLREQVLISENGEFYIPNELLP